MINYGQSSVKTSKINLGTQSEVSHTNIQIYTDCNEKLKNDK